MFSCHLLALPKPQRGFCFFLSLEMFLCSNSAQILQCEEQWVGSVVPLCWLVLLGEADQVLQQK